MLLPTLKPIKRKTKGVFTPVRILLPLIYSLLIIGISGCVSVPFNEKIETDPVALKEKLKIGKKVKIIYPKSNAKDNRAGITITDFTVTDIDDIKIEGELFSGNNYEVASGRVAVILKESQGEAVQVADGTLKVKLGDIKNIFI